MLRVRKDQPSLRESVLPEEVLALSEELTEVDALLDDERFLVPFREKFSTHLGRPTVPVTTYLRMMYLERRSNLGYENLVKEVKDSFRWRLFCHLAFSDTVPGQGQEAEAGYLRSRGQHPLSTDTSLIADGIKVITQAVALVKKGKGKVVRAESAA